MRPSQLAEALEQELLCPDRKARTPVMIWGPPGVGKSDIVRQLGSKHAATVIDLRLSQLEPSDLRGIPFKSGAQVQWAIPSMLPDQQRHGDTGILFLDELTSAVPSVSAAAYQLILDRRLGEYTLPSGWCLFAAGNRSGDRGITYTMPAPLANRFMHYELQLNLDDWTLWAWEHGIDERIIAFLKFRQDLLFQFNPDDNPVAFPTPRTWEFASRALKKFNKAESLQTSAIQACVGKTACIELTAFLQNYDRLPDIDALLKGENLPLPTETDLQYALATAIATRVVGRQTHDPSVIDRAIELAQQFAHAEIGIMLITDLARLLDDRVYDSQAFCHWAERHGEAILQ